MTDHLTENARLRAALEFYANPDAWNQPPVRTREGLFSVEYENEASKMQRDRGKIARAALATPAPDAVQEAARVLLAACPNPLFDRLKPIIMGEVTESIGYTDDVGNERSYKRPVSWTAMKEIIGLALRAISGDRT